MSPVPRVTPRRSAKARKKHAPAGTEPIRLDDQQLFLNREISLLEFQRRVQEEAEDAGNPLLERVKFLGILGSNLDEFFMVRVSALKHQVDAGIFEVGPDGTPPATQLRAIREVVEELTRRARDCFQRQLLPALAEEGIRVLGYSELDEKQKSAADSYFHDTIYPVLTPLAFDPGRPFPHISNLSLNLAILIRGRDGVEHFARLKVPDTLPQLVPVPVPRNGRSTKPKFAFIWLEELISANLETLFPGMEILAAHPFHVTRDADIEIQELEAADLLETIEEGVRQRRFGMVVRLKVGEEMPDGILDILVQNLELVEDDVYRVNGPLGLSRLFKLSSIDRPDLKEHPFAAALPPALETKKEDEDIFAAIRRENILLHHPFDSFQPVVDFLNKAAHDPDVLAIKMTLYRVGRNSPVVEALLAAMENGKQVAVLVELKARFDEESNIEWARALEREGVHVVYGLVGLKIHSKIALVVRREGKVIRRYVHLATGNYNTVTAHLYTDLGYFTCDEEIGADATDLFNYLTGYSAKRDYRKLLVAPINLRKRLRELIQREIEHHKAGRQGRLIFKMNALADKEMIQLLYEASQAGVQVDLLVRGVCCLRPGIPGISDNIRVSSVVGRFLEHSRIYCFDNGGDEEIYIGSADLMHRNISRRVEVVFPVRDPHLVRQIREEILAIYLQDNVKARVMHSDGRYTRREVTDPSKLVNSQEWLLTRGRRKD
ncbi:MAG: polyphosphate kinase 1 [Bryobacteraceae bacterium]